MKKIPSFMKICNIPTGIESYRVITKWPRQQYIFVLFKLVRRDRLVNVLCIINGISSQKCVTVMIMKNTRTREIGCKTPVLEKCFDYP
jgi:hypothetical protein